MSRENGFMGYACDDCPCMGEDGCNLGYMQTLAYRTDRATPTNASRPGDCRLKHVKSTELTIRPLAVMLYPYEPEDRIVARGD